MCLRASREASSRLRVTECFAVHSVFTWDTITNDEQTTGEAGYIICNIILCKHSFWSLEYTVISMHIAIKNLFKRAAKPLVHFEIVVLEFLWESVYKLYG